MAVGTNKNRWVNFDVSSRNFGIARLKIRILTWNRPVDIPVLKEGWCDSKS